jgi:hypothetical protein
LIKEISRNNLVRADFFKSEEKRIQNVMCVVAMGRESSMGEFRLGGIGETPRRITKPGGKAFWDDPVYDAIRASLMRLAKVLRPSNTQFEFFNPFLTATARQQERTPSHSVTLSVAAALLYLRLMVWLMNSRVYDKTKGPTHSIRVFMWRTRPLFQPH